VFLGKDLAKRMRKKLQTGKNVCKQHMDSYVAYMQNSNLNRKTSNPIRNMVKRHRYFTNSEIWMTSKTIKIVTSQ
jgi:hypothetical protein